MTKLSFTSGTGFDLFISLTALHDARAFGLRPAWAAGIRSRIPSPWKAILERYIPFWPVPLEWVASLPAPRDSTTVLRALEAMDPEERLHILFRYGETEPQVYSRLVEIAGRGAWSEADIHFLHEFYPKIDYPTNRFLEDLCDSWTHPAESGEKYLSAVRAYTESFYAEEELRLEPILSSSLKEIQQLSGELPMEQFLEQITQGVTMDAYQSMEEITLVPSYWSNPIIFFHKMSGNRLIMTYGARPDQASVSDEEPDLTPLVSRLEAVADPTRLRILHYLSQSPQTPSQLAKRLRLRAPTITHHLRQLRIAGLVRIILESDTSRQYALREEALDSIWEDLNLYIRS